MLEERFAQGLRQKPLHGRKVIGYSLIVNWGPSGISIRFHGANISRGREDRGQKAEGVALRARLFVIGYSLLGNEGIPKRQSWFLNSGPRIKQTGVEPTNNSSCKPVLTTRTLSGW